MAKKNDIINLKYVILLHHNLIFNQLNFLNLWRVKFECDFLEIFILIQLYTLYYIAEYKRFMYGGWNVQSWNGTKKEKI